MNQSVTIVQKLWNFCNILRDDGVSYGAYVEQLTYLLFLKMADETSKFPVTSSYRIPDEYNWSNLSEKEGVELEIQYRLTLEELAKEPGMLGVIFRKSQNKIQDPAKLRRLIKLIDGEVWSGLDIDIKGEIYEGLLEKNAEDIKSGAGQYFTPRPLIKAIVEVLNPTPNSEICDPASGTGGFILAAYDYITKNYTLDKEEKRFLKEKAFKGWDIVNEVVRLGTMNLFLHGIGDLENPFILNEDALEFDPGDRYDFILTNPPFGKKSSITVFDSIGIAKKEQISYERDDFWVTSTNKQLNFVQHIKTILKQNGKAGVVVPDNVLFEGGAGETIRRKLLQDFNLHTILRLPTGVFYAQGVKANVIFFDKKLASENHWTTNVWVYDLRTNKKFTLKTNPLKYEDLQDFIKCFNRENIEERQETERFHVYTYEEIMKRDKVNLDITWIKDDSLGDLENLPPPEEIAAEIVDNLEAALIEFREIYDELNNSED